MSLVFNMGVHQVRCTGVSPESLSSGFNSKRRLTPETAIREGDIEGYFDPDTMEIFYDCTLSKIRKEETILHELIHAAACIYGLFNLFEALELGAAVEELVASTLGAALCQALATHLYFEGV